MAGKTSRSTVPQDLDVDHPDDLRNVVLVGPPTSGKTSLLEALLAAGGAIGRPGTVADGTTVSDFEEGEQAHGHSMSLAIAPLVHDGTKINLLDTPGEPDFVGELRAGLRAADCALFVIAATDTIDDATVALWRECEAVAMPRVVAVTRLDHPRADYNGVLAQAREALDETVLPLFVPVAEDEDIVGLVGLLSEDFLDHRGGTVQTKDLSASPLTKSDIDADRDALIERIIEESEDERLMERYVGGGEVAEATLVADLERAVGRGSFCPAVTTCASGVGCEELLELLVRGFPPPSEHPSPEVFTPAGAAAAPVVCDPSAPLVAEVVKTTSDPYVGRVSLVRVFSGTLTGEEQIHVSGHRASFSDDDHDHGAEDHDEDERVGSLAYAFGSHLRPTGKVVAGDIAVVGRLSRAETGDTLSAPDNPRVLRPWRMPNALLPVALEPATKSDEDKLPVALNRLVAEDPSLRVENNADTRQLILWAMGESHAEDALRRLRNRFGVGVDQVDLRVPLRETFAAAARGHGRLVKQSGGHGQYAVCDIEVEPLPEGSGFEFHDKVVGGAVPRQFIPSVEEGVRSQMMRGLRSGHPVVDLRVTLTGGKAHSVDSSDAAFQSAGSLALRDAAATAGVRVLEPYDEITVVVPDAQIGTVMGDLSSRRGRLLGTDKDEEDRTTIRAHVPATELVRYAVDLRSATHGTGTFSRSPDHYEAMPEELLTS